jgi:hypothetical protein
VLAALASCPTLPKAVRRNCTLQFFGRHVRRGVRLSEVVRRLDHPTGVKDDDAFQFFLLGGFVPVNGSLDNDWYGVAVLPQGDEAPATVYLAVAGKTALAAAAIASGPSSCAGRAVTASRTGSSWTSASPTRRNS